MRPGTELFHLVNNRPKPFLFNPNYRKLGISNDATTFGATNENLP
jgi:hypothetical protein